MVVGRNIQSSGFLFTSSLSVGKQLQYYFVGYCNTNCVAKSVLVSHGSCAVTLHIVTVFDAILTTRQTHEKLQCFYENLMSNNFRGTAILNKYEL